MNPSAGQQRVEPRAVHIDARNVMNSLERRKRMLNMLHARLLEEFASWLWASGKSHETVYSYVIRLFFFLKYLEENGADVNGLTLLDLKKYMARKRKRTTQHGVKITLKAFLRFLIEAYDEPPPPRIKKEKLEEIYRYFKVENIKDSLPELPPNLPEIVEKLIEHASQPYKAILAIAYETGARREEILSLKAGDAEDAGDYIRIRIRKSKRGNK